MPLEQKVPMIPGPKDAYNLTRCKVGRKLWTTDGLKMDFDLSDPYCRETGFPYEALHDQHLLEFFSKPINLECLLKADLITKDMDAKCTLSEYNAYRKYLRNIHAARVGKELRRRDRLSTEKRALQYAEEQACKEVKRCNFLPLILSKIFFSKRYSFSILMYRVFASSPFCVFLSSLRLSPPFSSIDLTLALLPIHSRSCVPCVRRG